MTHILILWLVFTSPSGKLIGASVNGSIYSIEFGTKGTCEAALASIRAKSKNIEGVCVEGLRHE